MNTGINIASCDIIMVQPSTFFSIGRSLLFTITSGRARISAFGERRHRHLRRLETEGKQQRRSEIEGEGNDGRVGGCSEDINLIRDSSSHQAESSPGQAEPYSRRE